MTIGDKNSSANGKKILFPAANTPTNASNPVVIPATIPTAIISAVVMSCALLWTKI